jgi:hypothetical protein
MLVPTIFAKHVFSCSDYGISLNNVQQLPNGQYNWSYIVCHNKDYFAISHFILETCICKDKTLSECIKDSGSEGIAYTLAYGPDGSGTGITGLKFDSMAEFSDACKKFWFVVDKNYIQNTSGNIGLKASTGFCNYTTTTPTHNEVPSASEFPSIAVPLLVAGGAVATVYTLRKRVS